ncbi:MAG: right-handed parallel beta-helix repeat-containing protein [Candidatus Aenigmarchaeota archaeon]|nr:right-handed parallel beta-helix repeat-containing protein [Candidatus Aenigmarchaeota archaeon]
MRIKQILIIVFVITISGFFGYRFGLSQSGQFLKSVVEPGSMVSEVSYIVFTDGTNIYARNGMTGEIEFQGTDATTIIQSTINSLGTNGGKIFIKEGTYLLTDTIYLNSRIALDGVKGETELTLVDNVNKNVLSTITTNNNYYITISNLKINGNKQNNPVGLSGIYLWQTYFSRFENLQITNNKGHGINISASSGNKSDVNLFVNNMINANDGDGIHFERYAYGQKVISNTIFNNSIGIYVRDTAESIFTNNAIWENVRGFYSNYLSRSIIEGNVIHDQRQDGIEISGSDGYESWSLVIVGNMIRGNSQESAGNYDGIRLTRMKNSEVHDNIIDGIINGVNYHRYGIYELATSFNNSIKNNYVKGSVTTSILSLGSQTIVRNNYGYVTENSGTSTVINNQWVPHGLALTPSIVTLTSHSNVNVWVNDRNATHFQIGVSSETVTVDWYAEV